MKKLPQYPYLQNIVKHYRSTLQVNPWVHSSEHYTDYLRTLGFKVPIMQFDYLEFPDDFSEEDLMMFVLRWS